MFFSTPQFACGSGSKSNPSMFFTIAFILEFVPRPVRGRFQSDKKGMSYVDQVGWIDSETASGIYIAARSTRNAIFIPRRAFCMKYTNPIGILPAHGSCVGTRFSGRVSAFTEGHSDSWAGRTDVGSKNFQIWVVVASSFDGLVENVFSSVIFDVLLSGWCKRKNESKRSVSPKRAPDTHGFTTVEREREVEGDKFDSNFRAVLPCKS